MNPSWPTSNVHQSTQKTIEMASSNFINSVVFLSDGRHLVGGGFDGTIRRWRAEDGREVGSPLNIPGDSVLSLAASRDGKWVVGGMQSGLVVVWNAEDHSIANQISGHTKFFPVEAVDVSPDGTKIASGSHDCHACVWSLSTGERLLAPLEHENVLAAVKFSLDGRLLATATCSMKFVRIYDTHDGRLLVNMPFMVEGSYGQSLAWSNDSRQLFILSGGNIKRVNVSTGTTLSEWSIHSSTDPKGIYLASNGRFIAVAANTTVSFWDTVTEKRIGPIIEHADVLLCMTISQDYDLATSGARSTIIRSLREYLPLCYCDDTPIEQDASLFKEEGANLQETVKLLLDDVRKLRAQHESSDKKITMLEDTVQELRAELAESKRNADHERNNFNITIESLRSDLRDMKIGHLGAIAQEFRVQFDNPTK